MGGVDLAAKRHTRNFDKTLLDTTNNIERPRVGLQASWNVTSNVQYNERYDLN